MGRFLLRRVLLAVPPLIGLTLLVFALCALAPGAVGGAGEAPGSLPGSVSSGDRALSERLGLGDPVLVQYGRWLRGISPIKFGRRDQLDPSGGIVSPPPPVPSPPAVAKRLWAAGVPSEPVLPVAPLPDRPDERDRLFRQKREEAARATAAWIDHRAALAAAVASRPAGDPAIQEVLDRSRSAYERALASRAELEAIFASKPYPEAGVPIAESWVSIGWPDFGRTVVGGRPISSVLAAALPITLLVNALACVVVYLVGVPAGLLGAAFLGGRLDRSVNGALLALWSVPTVWACILAVGYVAHRSGLGWFPIGGLHDADASTMTFLPARDDAGRWSAGYLVDALYHLCLPVLCLSYAGVAVLARQVRAAAAEQLSSDYVRTARAKGATRWGILTGHVMRNCLLPLITMFTSMLPALLAGSVVVERVFAIPGMGTLALQAVAERDRGLLLATVVLVGSVCIVANALADVLYATADPRVRRP